MARQRTAEKWARLVETIRRTIEELPAEGKAALACGIGRDRELVELIVAASHYKGTKKVLAHLTKTIRALVDMLGQTAGEVVDTLHRRNRKPDPDVRARNVDIVRLHDQEGLSFGRIGKRLKLKYSAVQKAYQRSKRELGRRPGETN
jgi:hypothetical protein